ncbi:hypothetical protein G7Z17_g7592 [Cylindrodendrum hubeiense]|uniref:Apple domain-containing protein n=1 Tax=Cylindrodendrum hubeiense TaxID=595255 RepID=A0A9P5HB56_9HYPO|nr:hypothetical protein G7Z17_g7592 [Cylindrodendrum hubeiense]
MVSLKGLLLFSLGVEALAAQGAQVTCSSELGSVSVEHPTTETATETQTITQTTEISESLDETVTPTPTTEILTDFDTITVTETAGAETKIATEVVTNTISITTTNTISEIETQTSTTTSTSTTTTTTIPAPAGFTPIAQSPEYVAKVKARELGERKVANPGLTITGSSSKCKPVDVYPRQYLQSVNCIKTVIETVSKTVTTTVEGSTITLPAATESVTATETLTETSTEYPPDVSETITTSTDITITATEDFTTTSTTTTTATVQEVFPTSFYEACGASNIITNANGGKAIVLLQSTGNGLSSFSAANAYECCVGCFTTNAATCRGAFRFNSGVCYHFTSNTCAPSQLSGANYKTGSGTAITAYVMNGPCGRIGNGGSSVSAHSAKMLIA